MNVQTVGLECEFVTFHNTIEHRACGLDEFRAAVLDEILKVFLSIQSVPHLSRMVPGHPLGLRLMQK